MKKTFSYVGVILILLFITIDIIGRKNVYTYFLRLYNGTEVMYKGYSVELPNNWAIRGHYDDNKSTRIVGHVTEGTESNLFLIDFYKFGFARHDLLSKWSQCDHKSWYPLTTDQGKELAILVCMYDLNTTTNQKPSITLNDKDLNIIAAAYDWNPYYHNEYLRIFKSIKLDANSSYHELRNRNLR